MTEGNPIPPLSDEQRMAALEAATRSRVEMAAIRRELRSGELKFSGLFERPAAGRIRVLSAVSCLPGIGRVGARKLLEELGVSERRRIAGLGCRQRVALTERLG